MNGKVAGLSAKDKHTHGGQTKKDNYNDIFADEWEEDTMHILKANLHKILCGALVALALATLPLPALADNEAQPPEAATQVTAEPSGSTPPKLDITAPVEALIPPAQPEPSATTETNNESAPAGQPTVNQTPAVSGRVQNDVTSEVTSGSAAVTENEEAGDAATGNANASSTTINVANTNGATAGSFQTFECDITEDQEGNLLIDPLALPGFCQSTIPGSSAQPSASGQGLQAGANLTEILNNIILSATSGTATVDGNEQAGNATSGDATALANVLNIANTTIEARNSFLGVINIYADLKGDILVPQSLVDGLAGNSTGTQANGNATTNITNAINASATSGDATVTGNETAGNAASGEAMTSLTVLNLTGQQVVAKNSLLVFINVLGKWMGMIVPAPGTANASGTAMLGSGIQGNAASSTVGVSTDTTTNIINNITVDAKSGNATVSHNERAGNATSGKAAAGVNLLNITNSNFRLDDWFGALFINVLGSWMGDFDIQANAPTTDPTSGPNPDQIVRSVQVYQFEAPTAVSAVNGASSDQQSPVPRVANQTRNNDFAAVSSPAGVVLGTSASNPTRQDTSAATRGVKFDMITLGALVLALTMLAAVASLAVRHRLTA